MSSFYHHVMSSFSLFQMAARGEHSAQAPGASDQGLHHHAVLQPESGQGDLGARR